MRTISANNLAQAQAQQATLIHFIELQFSGGTLRLCTAPTTVLWNSINWQGTGFALALGPVDETTDEKGQAVPLKLSGVDQAVISVLLQQFTRGRQASIWRGWFNPTSMQLVDTPLLIFTGYMNEAWLVEEVRPQAVGPGVEPPTCTISTRLVSRLAPFEMRRGIQCNLMTHQAVYSGELFFQYVPSLVNVHIEWPNPAYFNK